MKHTAHFVVALVAGGLAASAWAKLPAPTPEQQAKAQEAAAKTAWAGKVAAFQLCTVEDRIAAAYRQSATAAGKTLGAVVPTPACTDPGPYVAPAGKS